jgi:LysR family nitrogen assimilation transcriptional regulator
MIYLKPDVELRHLGYFVAIAEAGTISGAAARLGIAQPSLSEVLVRLEKQLGVQLVIRSSRGAQLTEAGAKLADLSRDLLRGMASALDEVRHLGGEPRGQVAIGLPPSLSLLLGVPLVESVRQALPLVKLRVVEAMSGYIRQWVTTEHVDMGGIYEGQDCSHLTAQVLMREELFLVTAPDNWPPSFVKAGDARNTIEFAALSELPLILPSRPHGLRELLERQARSENVELNVVTEIDALRQITTIVDRASAYTILPHAAVLAEVEQGRLVLINIIKPPTQRTAYIVRKKGRPVSRSSQAVEAMIGTIIGELVRRHALKAMLPGSF